MPVRSSRSGTQSALRGHVVGRAGDRPAAPRRAEKRQQPAERSRQAGKTSPQHRLQRSAGLKESACAGHSYVREAKVAAGELDACLHGQRGERGGQQGTHTIAAAKRTVMKGARGAGSVASRVAPCPVMS